MEQRPGKAAQEARERTEPGFTISYATEASPEHRNRNEDVGQLISDPNGEGFVVGVYDGASKGGPEGSGQKASRAAATSAQENAGKLFGDPDKRGKNLRKLAETLQKAVRENGEQGKTTMSVTLFEKLSENAGRVTNASIGDSPAFVINIENGTIEQVSENDDPQQDVEKALTDAGMTLPPEGFRKDTTLTAEMVQVLAASGLEAVEARIQHVMAVNECSREDALQKLEGKRGNVFLSVLPRSLGMEGKVAPHVHSREVDLTKEVYLVCSDGIPDVLPKEHIVRTVIGALGQGLNPIQELINEVNKIKGAKPDDRVGVAVIPEQVQQQFKRMAESAIA